MVSQTFHAVPHQQRMHHSKWQYNLVVKSLPTLVALYNFPYPAGKECLVFLSCTKCYNGIHHVRQEIPCRREGILKVQYIKMPSFLSFKKVTATVRDASVLGNPNITCNSRFEIDLFWYYSEQPKDVPSRA